MKYTILFLDFYNRVLKKFTKKTKNQKKKTSYIYVKLNLIRYV